MMLCCKIMLGRSQLKQEKSLSIHLRKDFRWLGGGSFVYIVSLQVLAFEIKTLNMF